MAGQLQTDCQLGWPLTAASHVMCHVRASVGLKFKLKLQNATSQALWGTVGPNIVLPIRARSDACQEIGQLEG